MRSLHHLCLLLAIVAIVSGCNAEVVTSVQLPSPALPIQTTANNNLFGVYQADGTFSVLVGSKLVNTSVSEQYRGTAYHVLAVTTSAIQLMVAKEDGVHFVACATGGSGGCAALGATIPYGTRTFPSPVLTIHKLATDETGTTLVLASATDMMLYDRNQKRFFWHAGWKPVIPMPFDMVFLRESGFLSSTYPTMYLSYGYSNRSMVASPGMTVRVTNVGGASAPNTLVTYHTLSTYNFIPSRDYPNSAFWLQANQTNAMAYLNGWAALNGGSPDAPIAIPLLSHDYVSPSFMAEYPILQTGAIALGHMHTGGFGWTLQCFTFSYGFSSPTVKLTRQVTQDEYSGAPFLAIQPDLFQPLITGVAETNAWNSGYSIVVVDYGSDCPMPSGSILQTNEKIHSEKSAKSLL